VEPNITRRVLDRYPFNLIEGDFTAGAVKQLCRAWAFVRGYRLGGFERAAAVYAPSLPVVPMPEGMGDALVGADFLHGRRVWLSFATRHMFVTPLANGAGVIAALR
jgi:hypothetical protein